MIGSKNPSREMILGRIREALQTPADREALPPSNAVIFEPIQNPLERFQQECKASLTECILTTDAAASARKLTELLAALPEGEAFVQDDPALRGMMATALLGRTVRWSSEGAPREDSQVTVTLAEALVAQTGSILVSAGCGGRGASVVAPCHIVFATVSQLVPDLQTALSRASQNGIMDKNSFAGLVSGSSRTADIEKILVQGAHGPVRLIVVLQTGD